MRTVVSTLRVVPTTCVRTATTQPPGFTLGGQDRFGLPSRDKIRLQVSLALVFMVVAAGCATDKPLPSGAIRLLNGSQGVVGCPANVIEGDLVAHDSAGTAIAGIGYRTPIKWPYAYTGRLSGSVIEIVDTTGHVVARTGTKIRLTGGEVEQGIWLACPDPQTLP